MCFQFLAGLPWLKIAAAGGTVASVAGTVQAANAREDTAAYNAAVMRQRVAQERELALQQEADVRRDRRRKLASQRVALAASGVDPSSGTALDLIEESAAEFELDALRVRHGGANRALTAERSARSYDAQGRSARRAVPFEVAGDLFGTAERWQALR